MTGEELGERGGGEKGIQAVQREVKRQGEQGIELLKLKPVRKKNKLLGGYQPRGKEDEQRTSGGGWKESRTRGGGMAS